MSQLDTLEDMQRTLYIPVTSRTNIDYQVGLYLVYNNVWNKLAGLSQDIKNYLDYELIGHDYMCSHSVITYLE